MANRDYRKIERTIRDFCMNVGGGSPSENEVAIVDALPETAKEGDLAVLRSEVIDPECKDVSGVELKLYEVTDTNGPDFKMSATQIAVYPDEYTAADFYNALNKSLGREDRLLFIEPHCVSQSEFDNLLQEGEYVEFSKDTDLVGKPEGNYYRALGTKTIFDLTINQFFTPGEEEGAYQEWLSGDFLPYNGLLMKTEITSSKFRVAYRDYELDLETGNITLFTEWEILPESVHTINLASRTNQCYDSANLDDRELIDAAINSSPEGSALATIIAKPLDKEYEYALYQYKNGEWVEQPESSTSNVFVRPGKTMFTVDLKNRAFPINDTTYSSLVFAQLGDEYSAVPGLFSYRDWDYNMRVSLNLVTNEAQNQIIAYLQANEEAYWKIDQPVVIYEGDVSEIEDTSSIMDQLPDSIEITITEDNFVSQMQYLDVTKCTVLADESNPESYPSFIKVNF